MVPNPLLEIGCWIGAAGSETFREKPVFRFFAKTNKIWQKASKSERNRKERDKMSCLPGRRFFRSIT